MGGRKTPTISYWYGGGIHFVPCRDADTLHAIKVADKIVYNNAQNLSAGQVKSIYVNAPNAFGGEKREGGCIGTIDIQRAGALPVNPYLSQFQPLASAYRHVFSVILKRFILQAGNPYLKPWRFLLSREPNTNYHWPPMIGEDANPISVIYEVLTNADWGLGLSDSYIDLTGFEAAANELASEGMGISCVLDNQDIHRFIMDIMHHIDGIFYFWNGKYRITLIRAGRDLSNVIAFDKSNIIKMNSYKRVSPLETPNNIIVKYYDRELDRTAAVGAQDIAEIGKTGKRTKEINMPFFTNAELATRVAVREARKLTARPLSIKFSTGPIGFAVKPGDIISFNWPDISPDTLYFIVGNVTYSEQGDVIIEAVQYLYASGSLNNITGDASGWVSPYSAPAPINRYYLADSPLWLLAQRLDRTEYDNIQPQDGYIASSGTCNAAANFGYDIHETSPADRKYLGFSSVPSFITGNALLKTDTSTITVTSPKEMSDLAVGDVIVLYDPVNGVEEFTLVTSIAPDLSSIDVMRGAIDTTPQEFNAGILGIKIDELIPEIYMSGDTVQLKMLENTSLGVLADSSAPLRTVNITGRQNKPILPGNIKINNSYYPLTVSGAADVTVTLSHRNRLTNIATTPPVFSDGNYTPESGQTAELQLLDSGNNVLWSDSTTGTSTTIPQSALPAAGNDVTLKVWAERSGEVSYQTYAHTFTIT